jgi:bifunctional DNA-binding transcriptional regulator/antitoxin component of YhaV-PrlF toxin-antitoxin module
VGFEETRMGYLSKVQVIRRGEKNRQYYLICPAPLAQALEMEKSETIEWVVQDKQTLILRRVSGKMGRERRQGHGK